MWRNIQLFCKNLSVPGSLIQHQDKIRVFKDIFNFPRCKQILDILCNTCRDTTPLTESLPNFHTVCCCLFFFQQQMKLINIISGTLTCRAVDCYSIPDLILHNKHPQFFQLFSKVFNVKADHTVIQFHVCSVIKYFQRTININFKGSGKPLCFLLFLFPEKII